MITTASDKENSLSSLKDIVTYLNSLIGPDSSIVIFSKKLGIKLTISGDPEIVEKILLDLKSITTEKQVFDDGSVLVSLSKRAIFHLREYVKLIK